MITTTPVLEICQLYYYIKYLNGTTLLTFRSVANRPIIFNLLRYCVITMKLLRIIDHLPIWSVKYTRTRNFKKAEIIFLEL